MKKGKYYKMTYISETNFIWIGQFVEETDETIYCKNNIFVDDEGYLNIDPRKEWDYKKVLKKIEEVDKKEWKKYKITYDII